MCSQLSWSHSPLWCSPHHLWSCSWSCSSYPSCWKTSIQLTVWPSDIFIIEHFQISFSNIFKHCCCTEMGWGWIQLVSSPPKTLHMQSNRLKLPSRLGASRLFTRHWLIPHLQLLSLPSAFKLCTCFKNVQTDPDVDSSQPNNYFGWVDFSDNKHWPVTRLATHVVWRRFGIAPFL